MIDEALMRLLLLADVTYFMAQPLFQGDVSDGFALTGWAVTLHRPPSGDAMRTSRDLEGRGPTLDEAIRNAAKVVGAQT